ncbi:MAG: hypothetical protein RL735_1612 [Pseudomonadota bacterium]|jgi:FSR family fosmidomycin resistance protein-like MFS transporter
MTAVDTQTDKTPARKSFTEVWVVCIGHALTHWYPATFYIILPLIGNEFGLNYTQIGSIIAIQYAAGAIANIPGGMIVDSMGRKGILMALSLFWIGVPYVVIGYASAYWVILGCAILIGVGNNLWHPTAIPWLGKRFPDRKGLVMSFHSMGGNFGDAVAPLVIGLMLTIFTWREVLVMNVVPGVVMAILIMIYLGRIHTADKKNESTKPGEQRLKGRAYFAAFGELLKSRAVLLLSLSSSCRALTMSALMAFLPLYLANYMGYSATAVGVALFVMQGAGFAAAPIAGHLSDKMGRRQIIMSSFSVTAVVILGMIFAGGTELFVYMVALLGFFLFSIRAVLQAWLLDATPSNMGGSAIGIMFGMQAAGQAIGPYCAGVLADTFGIMSAFYFLAATIVIANFFVFFTPVTKEEAKA